MYIFYLEITLGGKLRGFGKETVREPEFLQAREKNVVFKDVKAYGVMTYKAPQATLKKCLRKMII